MRAIIEDLAKLFPYANDMEDLDAANRLQGQRWEDLRSRYESTRGHQDRRPADNS